MPVFWTLIGGFRGVLVAGATLGAAYLYNVVVDNPLVVHNARAGWATQTELEAVKAELAERTRQVNVSAQAYTELSKRLAVQREAAAAEDARVEQEIRKYKKRLADAGRVCNLDEGDIEWLEQH